MKSLVITECKKIENPTEKDTKNGFRYYFWVQQLDNEVEIENELKEQVVYFKIKVQDKKEIKINDKLEIHGKPFEMYVEGTTRKMRGINGPQKIARLVGEEEEL